MMLSYWSSALCIKQVHPLTAGTTMIDQFLCQCQVGLYSAPALLAFQVTTLPLAASGSHTSWLFGFQV